MSRNFWVYLAVIVLLIVGGVLAAAKISELLFNLDISLAISKTAVVWIVLLSVAMVLASACVLYVLGLSVIGEEFNFEHALIHNQLALMGKYIPGKVWGYLGRMELGAMDGMQRSSILRTAFIEQLIYLYVACGIGLCALLAITDTLLSLLPVLILLLLLAPLAILGCFPRFLLRLPLLRRISLILLSIDIKRIYICLILVCLSWVILLCLLSIFLIEAGFELSPNHVSTIVFLLGVYALSLIVGFAAFIVPGGLGVREGVFVVLASPVITAEVALSVSLMMRLWNVAYDILGGFLALYLSFRKLRCH